MQTLSEKDGEALPNSPHLILVSLFSVVAVRKGSCVTHKLLRHVRTLKIRAFTAYSDGGFMFVCERCSVTILGDI